MPTRSGLQAVELIKRAEDVAPESMRDRVCIVIDVLRATTTIVTALANGCRGIIPVETPEEARKLAALKKCLLGGERDGLRMQGFNFGNSPLEYTREKVQGFFIAFTTTNGTRAIRACAGADLLLIGSFLNAAAVAQAAGSAGKDISIVCAGTQGKPSIEDTVCGGMLADLVGGQPVASAAEAISLWRIHQGNLARMMKEVSAHGKRLVELGFEKDIEFAASIDRFDIVPAYLEGLIVRKPS